MAELEIYLVRHAESTNNVLQYSLGKIKQEAPANTAALVHKLEQRWLAERSDDPRSAKLYFAKRNYLQTIYVDVLLLIQFIPSRSSTSQ